VDPVIEPRWLLGKPDGLDAGGDHGIQAAAAETFFRTEEPRIPA